MKLNLTVGQRKYIENTFWTFLTQGLRLGAGFFIGLWLARYLGPSDYGTFNYVVSVSSLFGVFSVWGTTEIILKKIINSESKENETEILVNSLFLRMILGLITSLFFIAYIYFFQYEMKSLFFLILFTLIFQAFEVIDLFY